MSNSVVVTARSCILLSVCFCAYVFATRTEQKTPALAPDEKYRDLFPLTKANYTSKLLKSKDAWIVIIHNGSVDLQWKTMAAHLRGICWVGLIDTTLETELVKQLQFDVDSDVARVYPFGLKDIKGRKWHNVKTSNEARSAAVASLPDRTIRLYKNGVNDFYMEALISKPTRFPVYFICDEDETPTFLKAIASRFEKYFHFGRLVKPSNQEIQELGLGDTFIAPPALFVIVFQEETIRDVNAIQFKLEQNGEMNYANVMRFLFTINSEFRHQLPGDNQSNNQQEAEMADIMKLEEDRFKFLSMTNVSVRKAIDKKGDKVVLESPSEISRNPNREDL